MATPTGAISFANIQAEFGGSNPISINEYYRGAMGTISTNDVTLNGLPSSATAAASLGSYRGLTKTEFVATYGISWAYGGYSPNDTYYGYVDIYRGGKAVIRQQVWCGHNNVWWGQASTAIRYWNDASNYTTCGTLISADPYGSKKLYHDGGSLVLYNGGTLLAATSAPLA